MRARLLELRNDLGSVGVISVLVLLLATGYYVSVIKPLEERAKLLKARVENQPLRNATGLKLVAAGRAARLEEFYEFFNRAETSEEWLARLHGIATASGLELRTGDYQLVESNYRLARYRIGLPVTGTYTQIRQFLDKALDELPIVSLDNASFRRKNLSDTRVEADLLLTLHLIRR